LALLIQHKTGQNCFILNHLGSDTPKNGKKHSKFANFKELFCSEHASPGDYISVLAMPKFKHHEVPNIGTVIAAVLLIMQPEQALKRRALEIPALHRSRFQQK